MVKTFNISESVAVSRKGFEGGHERTVCPDCATHVQEKAQENDVIADCKNLFVDGNGEIVGQCCCYSKAHGIY